MLEGGFILLHRSILRWEWYGDLNTARLFIHLLLTVNYEPQRWQGIAVERGQRVASLAKLADETGLTVKQVRTALEHLKRTGEVTHTATSKYGLFTVNHYDRYQPRGEPEGMENGIPERACGTDAGAGTAAAKRPARADKAKFGEFENVLLDGREHGKLVDSLGDTGASEYIERLSVYLAQTGRCYKSHYAAILNWWRRDGMPVRRSPAPRVLKPDVGREITPDMTAEELF